MAGFYDRITIEGVRYFICAKCRRPHRPGTDAPYGFPEPGGIPVKNVKRQSLCGRCYREAYAFMYPPSIFPNQPDIPDNALDVEPILWDLSAMEVAPRTEKEIWGEAFAIWQRDGGNPQDIFERLWDEEKGSQIETTITEVQLEVVRR